MFKLTQCTYHIVFQLLTQFLKIYSTSVCYFHTKQNEIWSRKHSHKIVCLSQNWNQNSISLKVRVHECSVDDKSILIRFKTVTIFLSSKIPTENQDLINLSLLKYRRILPTLIKYLSLQWDRSCNVFTFS